MLACVPLMVVNVFCAFLYLLLISVLAECCGTLLNPDETKLRIYNAKNEIFEDTDTNLNDVELSQNINSTRTSVTTLNENSDMKPKFQQSPDERLRIGHVSH